METVEIASEAALAAFVRDNRYAVVHCWAVWNHYDVEMRKWLTELPGGLRDRIAIASLNVDASENAPIVKAHRVMTVPWLFLFRNGEYIGNRIGLGKTEQFIPALMEFTEHP